MHIYAVISVLCSILLALMSSLLRNHNACESSIWEHEHVSVYVFTQVWPAIHLAAGGYLNSTYWSYHCPVCFMTISYLYWRWMDNTKCTIWKSVINCDMHWKIICFDMDSSDEEQFGYYQAVPTFDIDDALSDANKFEHLPWEDRQWVMLITEKQCFMYLWYFC